MIIHIRYEGIITSLSGDGAGYSVGDNIHTALNLSSDNLNLNFLETPSYDSMLLQIAGNDLYLWTHELDLIRGTDIAQSFALRGDNEISAAGGELFTSPTDVAWYTLSSFSYFTTPVPEPISAALLIPGLFALAILRWRKK